MDSGAEPVQSVVAARLEALVSAPGAKQKLIEASGIPASSFARLLKGSNDPQTSSLVRVAEAAGVSLDWLTGLTNDPTPPAHLKNEKGMARDVDVNEIVSRMMSERDAIRSAIQRGPVGSRTRLQRHQDATRSELDTQQSEVEIDAGTDQTAALSDGFVAVPMLRVSASAGPGRFSPSDQPEADVVAFREDWLRSVGLTPGRTHALTAVGDSMEPTIRDGDLLLVDRSIDRVIDNGIYIVVFGGAVLVKRVQLRFNGSLMLKSENSVYAEEVVPPDAVNDVVIEGRVRWFGRGI